MLATVSRVLWAGFRASSRRRTYPLHRDRPNPLYRRVCYNLRVERSDHFRRSQYHRPSLSRLHGGEWYLKQIYRYASFPIAGTVWLYSARLGGCHASCGQEGRGARASLLYGTVWAMCIAQPRSGLMWYVVPDTRVGNAGS